MIVKDLGIIKNKGGFYLFKIQGIMSKERESKNEKKFKRKKELKYKIKITKS